ncbi:alpha-amylase family glycosyl hydrolase [Leptolinea tardivitalis]|uniref:Alpha-amylase n=1 Tax=Leptolinea tardivitalis TaxID=229920 RepID=A0A0P6XEA5_9CHLR|nr:alpha-amylase family glycosyl hydrolase [Leptolinea tardivitalis]KPL73180.1 alpha-amylase [Leptolinea tardivitalis]GAP21281.1 glycosidase [Leptolinea tardivitalis]
MSHSNETAIFYHLYPLGFCGAPEYNDFRSAPVPRLQKITSWLDHIQNLGFNSIYLGPVFESTRHGYDTVDYYHIDRRLGTDADMVSLSQEIHRRGMRLVFDGVFNHTGRNFWAFKDILANGQASPFVDWFVNLRFDGRSPKNDPFTYEGWNGHYDLVKLNLKNPQVKDHLLFAVESWIQDYQIDGIRLDAADQLDMGFIEDLTAFCKRMRPDFWLMGELIHGDYARWVRPGRFDSCTNYECYKGLYSSFNDRNLFEIAYSLKRQFGDYGIYKNLLLYSFADNHDVDRLASQLKDPLDLFNLYTLLYSMPGIPSLYYGSEWGISGKKDHGSDAPLRPCLDLDTCIRTAPHPELPAHLKFLAEMRQSTPALLSGSYRQVMVGAQQFAFLRESGSQTVMVVVNSNDQPAEIQLTCQQIKNGRWVDLLNPGEEWISQGEKSLLTIDGKWARVLQYQQE